MRADNARLRAVADSVRAARVNSVVVFDHDPPDNERASSPRRVSHRHPPLVTPCAGESGTAGRAAFPVPRSATTAHPATR